MGFRLTSSAFFAVLLWMVDAYCSAYGGIFYVVLSTCNCDPRPAQQRDVAIGTKIADTGAGLQKRATYAVNDIAELMGAFARAPICQSNGGGALTSCLFWTH